MPAQHFTKLIPATLVFHSFTAHLSASSTQPSSRSWSSRSARLKESPSLGVQQPCSSTGSAPVHCSACYVLSLLYTTGSSVRGQLFAQPNIARQRPGQRQWQELSINVSKLWQDVRSQRQHAASPAEMRGHTSSDMRGMRSSVPPP